MQNTTTATITTWVAGFVNVAIRFASEEERDAALATFPKSARLSPTLIGSGDEVVPALVARITTRANGANGGVNETGARRLRSIEKVLTAHGIPTHRVTC